jgi:hypothetical protein
VVVVDGLQKIRPGATVTPRQDAEPAAAKGR